MITAHIALQKNKMTQEEFNEFKQELPQPPKKINDILSKEISIKKLAEKYQKSKNVFFIG